MFVLLKVCAACSSFRHSTCFNANTYGSRTCVASACTCISQVLPQYGVLRGSAPPVQVNLSSGKHLRLPVKGCGMACALKLQPEVLHFGIVPSYQWADQLLQLSNGCPQLPMQLCVSASGPFFSSLPAQLELAPGGSGEVLLRYRPKVGLQKGQLLTIITCLLLRLGSCGQTAASCTISTH